MSTIECVGPAREQAQCRVHGGCWRSCRVPPHVPDWRARRECACIPMRDYRVHAQNEINDRLHGARPARSAPFAVVPSSCRQFPVPAQQRVQRAQRFATECVRFSREPLTFAVSEADAASAQAFFEQAILFLKVVDQIQLMTVDPSGEHHHQQVKRLKQGRHCCRVYRRISDGGLQRRRAAPFVRRLYNWTQRDGACSYKDTRAKTARS